MNEVRDVKFVYEKILEILGEKEEQQERPILEKSKQIKEVFSDYKNNTEIQECYIKKIQIYKKTNKML